MTQTITESKYAAIKNDRLKQVQTIVLRFLNQSIMPPDKDDGDVGSGIATWHGNHNENKYVRATYGVALWMPQNYYPVSALLEMRKMLEERGFKSVTFCVTLVESGAAEALKSLLDIMDNLPSNTSPAITRDEVAKFARRYEGVYTASNFVIEAVEDEFRILNAAYKDEVDKISEEIAKKVGATPQPS